MSIDSASIRRGPRWHRLGIYFLSVLLALLLFWLGTFISNDLDAIEPPEIPGQDLLLQARELEKKLEAKRRQLAEAQERQLYLEESTAAAQRTLDQLLELRKENVKRDLPMSESESKAFADSQRMFLDNQAQVQAVMDEILGYRGEERTIQDALWENQRLIDVQQIPLLKRHRQQIALYKFLFLAPFVLAGSWLLLRKRKSQFAPLIYAFNAAIFLQLLLVIHEHFPRRYYKYMFIALAIVVVVLTLIHLIRLLRRPSRNWLLQRYKEAYQHGLCPVCAYPITGPGTTGSVLELKPNEPYFCASCGTQIFQSCGGCGALRHSLLPHCLHCGAGDEARPTTD